MSDKYYLLDVVDGIEPTVRGPYQTEEDQESEAKRIRKEEQSEDDCLFWAKVDEDGNLTVGAYSGGFFMDEEEVGE
ncbi:MAG: hypothetical protein C0402_05360 [Thermodesulfovibrio sp.]|nr:hypothetical protein [Thermodesulfovibrio sp.]